jgi:hypothetical protein
VVAETQRKLPSNVKIEGGDKEDPKEVAGPAVAEAEVDPTPRLVFAFNNGEWGLTALRVKSQFGEARKQITYSPNGSTNTTVVKIDGVDHPFGGPRGRWVQRDQPPDMFNGRPGQYACKNVWFQDNIQVTQALSIVPSKQPQNVGGGPKRLLDTCLIGYQLENKDSRPRNVGFRIQVDTLIGSNDGVPFTIPGQPGVVAHGVDMRGPQVPDFIQALEFGNLQNPGTVAHMTLKLSGGFEHPDRMVLTCWRVANNHRWDVPVVAHAGDSCVVLYWNEKVLQPGQKRFVGFAYGLGSIDSDNEVRGRGASKLKLTLDGSFDPGETFTVTAYVSNPEPGQQLTLKLPAAGLKLVQGATQQAVQVQPGNATSLVTWRVRVDSPGRYPLSVESSTGATQSRTITITRPEPGKKKQTPDSIFR